MIRSRKGTARTHRCVTSVIKYTGHVFQVAYYRMLYRKLAIEHQMLAIDYSNRTSCHLTG